MDYETGLKASAEVSQRFPNSPNILHTRAGLLRVTTDTGAPHYQGKWSQQKKQVEIVKDAYKNYLKVTPKDHRQFAENNYVLAYLCFKYASLSSQMSYNELRELNLHYQNGLNAEADILPCFLPFKSEVKDFVSEFFVVHPPILVYNEGKTYTIDMTTHGMPGKPKPKAVPTNNLSFIDMRNLPQRRIDVCVPHRRQLSDLLADSSSVLHATIDDDNKMDSSFLPTISNNEFNDFEELILYQMSVTKQSKVFSSKQFKVTVVEDSFYSTKSGFFEMVLADTTDDVIKLQLDLGSKSPDNQNLKKLMKKFRFGTMWSLINPDFRMTNGDEKTMYLRATPECLIPTNDKQDGRKCRACFRLLTPGQHCSKCKRAAYCGKECQTKDWKYLKHSLICSEVLTNFFN